MAGEIATCLQISAQALMLVLRAREGESERERERERANVATSKPEALKPNPEPLRP